MHRDWLTWVMIAGIIISVGWIMAETLAVNREIADVMWRVNEHSN